MPVLPDLEPEIVTAATSPAETVGYERSELLSSADTEPPTITLQGSALEEVRQGAVYLDAGAFVYDAVDGFNVNMSVHGLDAVDTCCVTSTPFTIIYAAVDAAGNAALQVTRQVTVLPLCDAPSYLCQSESGTADFCALCSAAEVADQSGSAEEATSNVSCACLEVGIILKATDGAASTVESFTPEADDESPVLRLRGEGTLAVTEAGILTMEDMLLVGEAWTDPGAAALDAVDGDLTDKVLGFGAAAVSTSAATLPDSPYMITYTVSDRAGNSAASVQRRVHVTNPCDHRGAGGYEEQVCHVGESGATTCSTQGLCATVDMEEEEVQVAAAPPWIKLQGQEMVEVSQGMVYAACPSPEGGGASVDLVCDPGAEAGDELDGDLTDRVLACSPDGTSNLFASVGLAGCRLDTATPGSYTLWFSLANSAGATAFAKRTVVVAAECAAGEERCLDPTQCSSQGICLAEMETAALTEVANDDPPNINLRYTAAVPTAFVNVRQHQTYEACVEEEDQLSTVLCEPGAMASDAQDGELSSHVLACPPTSCLNKGCPGHEWTYKRLQGCLNTSAPVGTVYAVDFVVFDMHIPANRAPATRHVTIVSPCEDPSAELCDDLTCSSIPCATRDALLLDPEVDSVPPVISLLVEVPTRVQYGSSSSAAALQRPAAAWDSQDGDVSESLRISQDAGCAGCASGPCAMELADQCFPGTYSYLLEAWDVAGNRGVARLDVTVVREGMESAAIVIDGGVDAMDAEAQATALEMPGSPEAAAWSEGLASALSSSGGGGNASTGQIVRPEDISITAVTVVQGEAATPGRRARRGLGEEGFSLLVSTEVRVAVASEDPDTLDSHSTAIEESLVAVTGNGEMSASLAAAAAANGAQLTSRVEGIEGEVTSRPVSPEVDPGAVALVGLIQEVKALQQGSEGLYADLAEALETVAMAGGNPGEWQIALWEVWEALLKEEFANVESLMDSAAALLVRAGRPTLRSTAPDAVREETESAELNQLQAAQRDRVDTSIQQVEALVSGNDWQVLQQESSGEYQLLSSSDRVSRSVFAFSVGESSSAPLLLRSRRLQAAAGGGGGGALDGGDTSGALMPWPRSASSGRDYAASDAWSLETADSLDEFQRAPTAVDGHYLALGRNRMAGGMLLHMTQGRELAAEHCTRRFKHLGAPCARGVDTQPYGSDPVFRPGSSLFRADLVDDVERFYNTSPGSNMLDRHTRSPLPFRSRHVPHHPDRHAFFIEDRIGGYRAQQVYTFLEEGQAVADSLAQIRVNLACWNSHLQAWSWVELAWAHPRGAWETSYDVAVLPRFSPSIYSENPGTRLWWLSLLHLLWILLSVTLFAATLASLRPSMLEDRYKHSTYQRNILEHLSGLENILGALAWCLPLTIVAVFCAYIMWDGIVDMDASYDVYDDSHAEANYFLSTRLPPEADDAARWTLPEDNRGLERYGNDLATMEGQVVRLRMMFKLQAAQMLLMVLCMLLIAKQQPHLAVVMRTCVTSSQIILQQFIVFMVIAGILTVLLNIQFGDKVEMLSTLPSALDFIGLVAVSGVFQNVENLKWESTVFETATEKATETVCMFIFRFIFSNFIIAVISDELSLSLKQAHGMPTVLEDFWWFYNSWIQHKIFRGWPDVDCFEALLVAGQQVLYDQLDIRVRKVSSNKGVWGAVYALTDVMIRTSSMRSSWGARGQQQLTVHSCSLDAADLANLLSLRWNALGLNSCAEQPRGCHELAIHKEADCDFMADRIIRCFARHQSANQPAIAPDPQQLSCKTQKSKRRQLAQQQLAWLREMQNSQQESFRRQEKMIALLQHLQSVAQEGQIQELSTKASTAYTADNSHNSMLGRSNYPYVHSSSAILLDEIEIETRKSEMVDPFAHMTSKGIDEKPFQELQSVATSVIALASESMAHTTGGMH
ncbi:hypothetical protein CYMTET_28973 [Cymbomonas tetramitiformis]|uniref:Pesticidal crystal protein Cry22Aa Ig-like domain-containing protein n=1 Tax=Cymbomonas tetramitiformis TaxID=36881 RepID=A0AAE0FLW5_9CHLO|nr:hypothetical protein CYMTET_28973 [Cymbomonas tetramitiformis]